MRLAFSACIAVLGLLILAGLSVADPALRERTFEVVLWITVAAVAVVTGVKIYRGSTDR